MSLPCKLVPGQYRGYEYGLLAGAIYKPSSMWTFSTCLYPDGQCQEFAVIGNNVPNPP